MLDVLLIDEAWLLPLTLAIRNGQVELPARVQWVSAREAETIPAAEGLVRLAPPGAALALAASEVIVADLAVVDPKHGCVALAAMARPDELRGIEIDCRDVSRTTESLGRFLAHQHFGATGWRFTRQPAPGAPARLLEGDAALLALAEAEEARAQLFLAQDVVEEGNDEINELFELADADDTGSEDDSLTIEHDQARAEEDEVMAEDDNGVGDADDGVVDNDGAARADHGRVRAGGAVVEDLARAWYILTGRPWVSLALLAPRQLVESQAEQLRALIQSLQAALEYGQQQPGTVRRAAAERLAVRPAVVRSLFTDRRYRLDREAIEGLQMLLRQAARQGGHRGADPTIVTLLPTTLPPHDH